MKSPMIQFSGASYVHGERVEVYYEVGALNEAVLDAKKHGWPAECIVRQFEPVLGTHADTFRRALTRNFLRV